MNKIKTILAICVLSSIGYFLVEWYRKIEGGPNPITPPINIYTEEIQKKINTIKLKPVNTFCPKEYRNIMFGINDFHKQGALGTKSIKKGKIWKDIQDSNNNNLWKDILIKNLYAAYSQKFIDQSNFIFNDNLWRIEDIRFIRQELQELRKSPNLNSNNATADSFKAINTLLNEYDQVNGFIISCDKFEYNDFDISSIYPDVSKMIKKSKSYGINGFNNSKLFNCKRLIDGINVIPQILFNKHVSYLIRKIKIHASKYEDYNNQKEYNDNIYNALESQVNALSSNQIYNVSDNQFNKDFTIVNDLLLAYSKQAYSYFRKPQPTQNSIP